MADKTIGSLPQATELDEESLLVTEQLGEARSVTGALLADYAQAAAQQEAQKAGEYAQSAEESATAAAQKAQEAQNVATKPPYIQGENWWVWDEGSGAYVDSGVDASVSLAIADTVTGAPGSDAMVENIGTASDLLLRFTIPRGEKGEVGSVNSVNEKTGDVTLQAQDIPTAAPQDVSAWTDVQAYLDGLHTQSKVLEDSKAQPGGIATLNSSGKLEQMPTAADVGAVPTSRTVNGKALSSDITLVAADVGAKYKMDTLFGAGSSPRLAQGNIQLSHSVLGYDLILVVTCNDGNIYVWNYTNTYTANQFGADSNTCLVGTDSDNNMKSAGIRFMTKDGAHDSSGTYCYLPYSLTIFGIRAIYGLKFNATE